jgi:hypothetical protein
MNLTPKERACRHRQKDKTPSPRAVHGRDVMMLSRHYNLLRVMGCRGADRRPMPRSTFYRYRKQTLQFVDAFADPAAWRRLCDAGMRETAIATLKFESGGFLLADEWQLLHDRLEICEPGLGAVLADHPKAEMNKIAAGKEEPTSPTKQTELTCSRTS